jgi:hypothetical protein
MDKTFGSHFSKEDMQMARSARAVSVLGSQVSRETQIKARRLRSGPPVTASGMPAGGNANPQPLEKFSG